MDLILYPRRLEGVISVPPSKSLAHRWVLGASLAEGTSSLEGVELSRDIAATLACMESLGAHMQQDGPRLSLVGRGGGFQAGPLPTLACGASGSTLRFLLPLALVLRGGGRFTGEGRLLDRPLDPLLTLFQEKGVTVTRDDGALTVEGRLTPGTYALRGDVSSQFFTGLLFALPLLPGPSLLRSTTVLESRPYIDLTLSVLEACGVSVRETAPGQFHIPGGQTYRPLSASLEGDWSQAGFWCAANALGSHVRLRNLREDSRQQDRLLCQALPLLSREAGPRRIDLRMHPDMALPLAPWAACREGTTLFTGCGRLRYKESDRWEAILRCISALGGSVEAAGEDCLCFTGCPQGLRGGCALEAGADHRVAMMAAIAATVCREPILLRGAECVAKSYPHFWEDYTALGGEIHEYTGK